MLEMTHYYFFMCNTNTDTAIGSIWYQSDPFFTPTAGCLCWSDSILVYTMSHKVDCTDIEISDFISALSFYNFDYLPFL